MSEIRDKVREKLDKPISDAYWLGQNCIGFPPESKERIKSEILSITKIAVVDKCAVLGEIKFGAWNKEKRKWINFTTIEFNRGYVFLKDQFGNYIDGEHEIVQYIGREYPISTENLTSQICQLFQHEIEQGREKMTVLLDAEIVKYPTATIQINVPVALIQLSAVKTNLA